MLRLHAGAAKERDAEKSWPLIGLESLGMNLEDIFISIVDTTDKPMRRDNRRRVTRNTRDALEQEYAKDMIKKTSEAKSASDGQ